MPKRRTHPEIVAEQTEDSIVAILLEVSDDSQQDLVDALCVAARRGLGRAVEVLLDKGVAIDQPSGIEGGGWNALLWAVEGRRVKVVDLLLSRGANPNAWDPNRFSPLLNRIEGVLVELAWFIGGGKGH